MKQILDFFKENYIKIDDISEIFVNQGPGNFSAIRGSLSTAKGISIAKRLKLDTGWYYHLATNMHIYNDKLDKR